jgi:hypothetical protein
MAKLLGVIVSPKFSRLGMSTFSGVDQGFCVATLTLSDEKPLPLMQVLICISHQITSTQLNSNLIKSISL